MGRASSETRAVILVEASWMPIQKVVSALQANATRLGVEVRTERPSSGLVRTRSGSKAALRQTGAAVASAVAKALDGRAPWVGIGEPITGGHTLPESRREAEQALRFGPILSDDPRVVLFEDVLVCARLFEDRPTCARFAAILDPLQGYDADNRTELLATLEAYFAADLSPQAACRELGIHRHTLDYRLRRIERVLARSVRTGQDRLLIETALLARRLSTRMPPIAASK